MEQRHTLGRATNADHPFRMLLDHLPTPAWACRPDGTTALLNQCWLDYTGLSLAQALAEGWHGPVHPDDRGPLRETWARLRAAGAPGEAEVRLRRVEVSSQERLTYRMQGGRSWACRAHREGKRNRRLELGIHLG
jgi:PAS domain-containing protein